MRERRREGERRGKRERERGEGEREGRGGDQLLTFDSGVSVRSTVKAY